MYIYSREHSLFFPLNISKIYPSLDWLDDLELLDDVSALAAFSALLLFLDFDLDFEAFDLLLESDLDLDFSFPFSLLDDELLETFFLFFLLFLGLW